MTGAAMGDGRPWTWFVPESTSRVYIFFARTTGLFNPVKIDSTFLGQTGRDVYCAKPLSLWPISARGFCLILRNEIPSCDRNPKCQFTFRQANAAESNYVLLYSDTRRFLNIDYATGKTTNRFTSYRNSGTLYRNSNLILTIDFDESVTLFFARSDKWQAVQLLLSVWPLSVITGVIKSAR